MKRLLLIMLLFAAEFSALWAKDIIITQDAERIDAIITEVSETEVKYKKANNPEGPTFVLSTGKIASILYQNGEVQTFEKAALQQSPSGLSNPGGQVVTVRDAKDIVFVPGQYLEKSEKRRRYYYGNVELDEGLYKEFLQLNCPAAYNQYKSGMNMVGCGWIIGGCMAGLGLGLASGGKNSDALLISGVVIAVSSVAVWVPLVVCGGKKVDKAFDTFNSQCAQSQDYASEVSLNLGITGNGIGLTLNF